MRSDRTRPGLPQYGHLTRVITRRCWFWGTRRRAYPRVIVVPNDGKVRDVALRLLAGGSAAARGHGRCPRSSPARTGADSVMSVEVVGPVKFAAVPAHRAFGSLEFEINAHRGAPSDRVQLARAPRE